MNAVETEILNHRIYPESVDLSQHTLAQNNYPLIILHGLFGSMDNWRTQAKLLSAKRPVITLDLRNHGNSPHLKGMSYREMYEDVIKLAKHLDIPKFDLLGHSMGGKVAMQLALGQAELGLDLLNKLIVVDIAPRPYPLWHQTTLKAVLDAPIETLDSRQAIDDYLKESIDDVNERAFMIKNLRRANKEKDDSDTGFRWKIDLREIAKSYLKIAGFTTSGQTFSNKTLFIDGEDSRYMREQDHPIINALFPNAAIKTIKDSDHLPHIQQPEAFFSICDTFLSPAE